MRKPNIVLIMSDQHHKRAMSSANHPYVKTPAMDRLASRGISFRQAFCNYPLCGPSRAAFMTAQHPHKNGVLTNAAEIRTDTPTFAHQFLASGYETVLSGRMHFVGIDQRHGFEKRLIGDVPESAHISAGWKLSNVLGDLGGTAGMSRHGVEKSGPGRSGYLSYDEHVTEATVKYLEDRKTKPSDKPYLLTVGYVQPHCPFVAESDDFYQYWNQLPTPDISEESLGEQHPFLEELRRHWGVKPLPAAETFKRVQAAYYGMVNHLDRQINAVLEAIEASGEADNTIIVYTSDHGEQLGEHGLWWKSTFYEGSVGVPLIISRPDDPRGCPQGRAGQETQANVSLIDIGPTLLDLAGLDPLPGANGQSFRCVLDGKEEDWCDEVFAELSNALGGPDMPSMGTPQRMFKQGPWKYVYYHNMRPQLFNTTEDPFEEQDLWNDPAQADRIKAMQARALEGWDPEKENLRYQVIEEQSRVISAATRAAMPPEPDPVWFETPPENYIEPIQSTFQTKGN